jgi:two-component system, cell cycle sensor histidine kinase and response regulator CckA
MAPKVPQCAGEPGAAMPETVISGNASGKITTVLMIEDEETLRVPVAKILRRQGFTVLETGDGGSAVDLYRERAQEIDVVFLDMTLPTLPGADVMAELELIRPGTKVVLTSAYSLETVTRALRGQRPRAFIRKPYASSELVKLLWAICPLGVL